MLNHKNVPIFVIVFFFNPFTFTQCGRKSPGLYDLEIAISPQTTDRFFVNDVLFINLNEHEPLNLTCKLVASKHSLEANSSSEKSRPNQEITWLWLLKYHKSEDVKSEHDSLIFPSIKALYDGYYTCYMVERSLKKTVRINVNKKNITNCYENMWKCSNSSCLNCKQSCQDKAHCEGDRCTVMSWCCEWEKWSQSCILQPKPSCCYNYLVDKHHEDEEEQHEEHNDEVGFHLTAYEVFKECVPKFLYVIVYLVFWYFCCNCRKSCRSANDENPTLLESVSPSAIPLHMLERPTDGGGGAVARAADVQIVINSRPSDDPPPYCEAIGASAPPYYCEGADPPPYSEVGDSLPPPPPSFVSRASMQQSGDSPGALRT